MNEKELEAGALLRAIASDFAGLASVVAEAIVADVPSDDSRIKALARAKTAADAGATLTLRALAQHRVTQPRIIPAS
jgi:hypothetical protein